MKVEVYPAGMNDESAMLAASCIENTQIQAKNLNQFKTCNNDTYVKNNLNPYALETITLKTL